MRTASRDLPHGVLDVHPQAPFHAPLAPGLHELDTPTKPAVLHVPIHLPLRPVPLLVAFHKAGGAPDDMLALLRAEAERRKFLLLAPRAHRVTWDAVVGRRFGKDAVSVQHAMAAVFGQFPVDRDRIAVAGFSDGASYALGLGLANGDLFSRVLAYSPGRVPPGCRTGRPTIFVSHGRRDTVLPVTRTSRRIVPALEDAGYHVDYLEHDFGHHVPQDVVTASTELLG
ncbi:alpha/beta hydrolase-fold protein [Streptomyces sp. NPDC026673]|uniref:alpha/beta hydrolase n=1 Tax=Streptomyces sp. NPDC026673 TaxID=3155724 RepID=UPI00340D2FDD